MLSLLVALTLSLPPSIPLSHIAEGKVKAVGECLWRKERSTCFYLEHQGSPYILVHQKQADTLQLRYILTYRDGKFVEAWSHDSKET